MKTSRVMWIKAFIWLMRIAIYMLLPITFFFVLSKTNAQLLRLSRTCVITASTYALVEYLFSRIYGYFQPGLVHIRTNIASLSLTAFFTDIIAYVQMQVMNVNPNNNSSLELLGVDALLLLLVLSIQVALIVVTAYVCHKANITANPPRRTCIITDSEEDREIICEKLTDYRRQFTVEECVLYTDSNVRGCVKRAEAVLLFHLPPAAHQELIAYAYKHRKVILFDMNIGNIVSAHSQTYMLDDVLMRFHFRNSLSLPQRILKRIFDLLLSVLALIALSPVFVICAVAIKMGDGGSVFFRQKRITRNNRIFYVLKFRTMKEHAEDEIQHSVQTNDDRVTRVGAVLRRFRLDELPQFINILRGEMSLVGPRPEMVENVEMYTHDLPEFAYRSRVKAGLTGYAQIDGKYNTSPRDKLMMDITYIENYSIWLDIKLLLKTVLVFFSSSSTQGFSNKKEENDL